MLSAREWLEIHSSVSDDAREVLLSLASLAGSDYSVRSSVAALSALVGFGWTYGSEVVKIWVESGDVVELQPDHPAPLYVFPGYRDYLVWERKESALVG